MTDESLSLTLYSMIYLLFAICIIFPPTEFASAGLTLDNVFGRLLGDEQLNFVEYHLRRSTLTIVLHLFLPLFYFVFLHLIDDDVLLSTPPTSQYLAFGATISLLIAVAAITFGFYRKANDWERHPAVAVLRLYHSHWRQVAETINTEYRRIDKFSVALGTTRVVVTDSWIIRTSPYALHLVQSSDAQLRAVHADQHNLSHHSADAQSSVQFVNIEVICETKPIQTFIIRMNAEMLRDLRSKLSRPVDIARNVILLQSINDRFVQTFIEHVQLNPHITVNQAQDLCLGCGTEEVNVKLEKRCVSNGDDQQRDDDGRVVVAACSSCFCRPMWCVACMARIFAAKQELNHPERWLSGKCPCPTCRSPFCVIDVSLIDIIQ